MLTILQPSEVPPGGWTFRDPETDFLIKHNNLENLFNLAVRHRQANNMKLSQEAFVAIVCQSTSGAGCSEDGAFPSLKVQAQNLAHEMATWAKDGFGMATDAVLASRVKICEACEHWAGTKGGSLMKGRCRVCGCRGIKLALGSSKCPIGRW